MSEYLKQAEDLLEKLDVTLTTEFVSHRPYFQDDTESRDVYMVLLTRRNSSMSFLF